MNHQVVNHRKNTSPQSTHMQHYLLFLSAASVALACTNAAPAASAPAAAAAPSTPAAASTNTLAPKDNTSTNATAPAAASGGSGGTAFTEDDFKKAVTALGKADAASKADNFIKSLKDAAITTKQEAAMFLAQCWHESDKLQAKEEYACKDSEEKKKACDKSYPPTPGKGVPGKHYYGRGYIQLTWDYNYEKASQALFGDGKKLLENPDLVASDDALAWRTAAWYWQSHVHSAPGVKDGKFGATTKAINGALECNNPQGEQLKKAKLRFEYYTTIMKAIGDSGKLDETGCYS